MLQLTGQWLEGLPPAAEAGVRAWFAAAKPREVAPTGDRLPLWLRTTPAGRHLSAALEALTEAPRHILTRGELECLTARAWLNARGEVVPRELAAWILAHKDGRRLAALVQAFRGVADAGG